MNARSYAIPIVVLMSLLGFFSFCKGKSEASVVRVEYGPFTLQKRQVIENRFDYNRGKRVKSAYSRYKILYREQPITFPEALEVNTGYSSVWKAFILPDAPRPVIIAGSQSVYLIAEENGTAKVLPINEQNSSFASLQWLDSENGQPGLKQEIYISEDTSANCALSGGQYLLVNQNTVLQISDLSLHPFRRSIDLTDGYYAGNVVAFSPGKEEIVFVGSKKSEARYDKFVHALLVYNFKTNAAYVLPFDQTETRLYRPDYITADWLDTYFEWRETADGKYVLEKRVLTELPYWQGIYTQQFSYELTPVKADILPVLLDFVRQELSLSDTDIKIDHYGDYKPYRIQVGEFVFSLGYMEQLNMISFSKSFMGKDSEAFKDIVKRVGDGFNAELSRGKYQDLFTTY